MRPAALPALTPVTWTEAEPERLHRDQQEVTAFEASLQYESPGGRDNDFLFPHGGWHGVLPVWPFERPKPDGLDAVTGGAGLKFALMYPAAYPMIAPIIRPLSPEPEFVERTQTIWHVLPSGGLCLLRSEGTWLPEASVVELLLKAAGWRIEYALMKAQAIDMMSSSGIVSDDSFDHLVAQAAVSLTAEREKPDKDGGT